MTVINSTRVVAAFPGCGKTTVTSLNPDISDLDSSFFDKSAFPGNYLEQIARQVDKQATFVSSHLVVREALVNANIDFWLVFPARECKEEYIQRYQDRGSPESFIQLLNAMWDVWISECEEFECPVKIVIKPGHYLSDVIKYNSKQRCFEL